MTPRPSIIGTVVNAPVFREPNKRRLLFVVLIAICAVLTLFPQKYRAATSLTPTDPSSMGLSGTLGQLGAVNSVFGNQAAIEISLKVARSRYVRTEVSKRLNLPQKLGQTPLETYRWLDRKVDARALRGGILQFEIKLSDADLAEAIIAAYSDSVRAQLATIARQQTSYKRDILLELVSQANNRLTKAQEAYDTFRLRTRYSQPQTAISAIGERIPELEAMIRAKQVQLHALRQFNTDDSLPVKQVIAEISALNSQLKQTRSTSPAQESSVGRVVRESTQVDRLRRELDISQTLYENYKRFLQGTTVEDLTSAANVRILEPAYLDTDRQYNLIPAILGLLLLLLAGAIEFYSLRPPLGDRTTR